MARLTRITGIAAPLMRRNIDTDAIIPGKELIKVEKTGYGKGLFRQWRFIDGNHEENPDFILNKKPYRHAVILLTDENFGCGSSREAAVWALADFGIRCVIAPSFASIFYSSSFKNGLLPVILKHNDVQTIAHQVEESDGKLKVTVDLEKCHVIGPEYQTYQFAVNDIYRQMLLQGLDPIDATLEYEPQITAFQERDRKSRPWIYQF